jgi:NAD(P)-dependent dehydrogenase (short-subunit alcohol dehydrogenase family)
MLLQEKVVVVTGAGGGIGMGIAKRFSEEGAKVVVNDINANNGERVAGEIRQTGGNAVFIQGNVSREADAEHTIQQAVESFGRVDILVNNAGIELVKAITDITEEEWDRVIGVNLKGCFLMSKHAVSQMLKQNKGNIINIASLAGLVGFPLLGSYCASKGGIIQLTRVLALEYRSANIRANVICPALVKTDLGDRFVNSFKDAGIPVDDILLGMQSRVGTLEDVANAAVFLASDASSLINGVALPVDGGAYAA